MTEATAILLAAGLSTRMGVLNKLLLKTSGIPMIRHIALQYQAAIDGPVLVVLGHEANLVKAALDGTGVDTVFNADFAEGQFTSVATGLRNAVDAKVLLIGLGDQPLLQHKDFTGLLTSHRLVEPDKISIPVNEGARGNPLVVPRSLRARLLEGPKIPGCQRFTRAHPELVQELPLQTRGLYIDVDTPEDYQNQCQRKLAVDA